MVLPILDKLFFQYYSVASVLIGLLHIKMSYGYFGLKWAFLAAEIFLKNWMLPLILDVTGITISGGSTDRHM